MGLESDKIAQQLIRKSRLALLPESPDFSHGEVQWRGRGSPESGKGNWVNQETGESLHPDHNHPPGKAPHWGYTDSAGVQYDLFLDGSWQ